ncbi:MAG: PhnD/SsuA/transferrin family substrate-binding protein [Methylococcaceae bacterium]|nr:PhnD/SsuA/transferrin family substrate-binding protein [Methylococcaceae bacterium]MCI0667000.1 PhnD/SsuA/transferrin family substrate-binding protein [Methylococcaceae bacterium]
MNNLYQKTIRLFLILSHRSKSLVLALLLTLPSFPAAALESASMTFVGVALDPETQEADERLRQYFQAKLRLKFENRDLEYSAAIQTLKNWQPAEQGPVMARITPYVYVVAEMLGASLEILATYKSKKPDSNLYHAYFVVRRSQFSGSDLDEFVQHLRKRETPARFVYHNKFSTSSFFLPSLYFREKDIFSVPGQEKNDRNYITIQAERPELAQGSSDLVGMVKGGQADFAAIWDGTKTKFDNDPELVFLKLPTPLPNDLLVVSRSTDPDLKEKLHQSIGALTNADIDVGDFLTWVNFNETPKARNALAMLRWKAKALPKPVPIQVREAHRKGDSVDESFLEAARQAIRLSGTEFVVFDEDFHKHFDVLWRIRKTHENALEITSEFIDSGLAPQIFHISFQTGNLENLVYRIGSEIDSRMHRIRYIWPFDDNHPRVIRDVDFDLPEGDLMKGQKVTWKDLSNNDSSVGDPFDVQIARTDFNSFELAERGFAKRPGTTQFDFDPMSNVSYRIFLVRAERDTWLIQALSTTLTVLFALAGFLALYSIWRKPVPTS